jgi:hypothetical protein
VIPIEPFKEDGEGVLESDGFGLTEGPTVEIGTFPAGHDFPFAHALGQIANRPELVFVKILAAVVALMKGEHRNLLVFRKR